MGGRLYLRKYQASSAMMSSSRDRTSTVGMTCRLLDATSSKEGGEAEPRGQGAPSTKKQEDRGDGGGQGHWHAACVKNILAGKETESC